MFRLAMKDPPDYICVQKHQQHFVLAKNELFLCKKWITLWIIEAVHSPPSDREMTTKRTDFITGVTIMTVLARIVWAINN